MSVISIVYIWPELFLLTAGLFWQLSLLIHSTLESVTTIMTLLMIKTVFALCVPSCFFIVRCVPSVLGWAAAIVATRNLIFFSAFEELRLRTANGAGPN